jgi:hypothetical protein
MFIRRESGVKTCSLFDVFVVVSVVQMQGGNVDKPYERQIVSHRWVIYVDWEAIHD